METERSRISIRGVVFGRVQDLNMRQSWALHTLGIDINVHLW